MTQALTTTNDAAIAERVMILGDLSQLSAPERVAYYGAVCRSLGLNPLTKPFDYLSLNNKLTLYAKRDATDQLRGLRGVSITQLERDLVDGVYTVVAHARTPDGRTDSSIGAVNIEGLKGEARANAMMKAETKAKRRVTLSICGLGMIDETEAESIPDAKRVNVTDDGVIESTPRVVTTPQADPVAEAAQKLGGSVRVEDAREAAKADWAKAASECKRLNLTQAIEEHKVLKSDDTAAIKAKVDALLKIASDYEYFERATQPAQGEQQPLINVVVEPAA